MAPKKRLAEIDDVRGISIILVILIHTNAYFLGVPLSFLTLELSQFAVVAFIFCSTYLFFLKQPTDFTWGGFAAYLWKRIKRMVIPYYVFLAVYSLFLLIAAPKNLTPAYFLNNLTLAGGIDFNWMVLLFIEFAILMPLLSLLYRKYRPAFIAYNIVAIASTLIFLLNTPLPFYRWVMWLPWSLILSYTMFTDRIWKDKRLFFAFTLLFLILFVAARQWALIPFGRSLRQYDNKYPPNMYHLAYSLLGFNIVYFLSKLGAFRPVRKFIRFYSLNSYPIYFIHILVIYAVTVFWRFKFNWITFFLAVFCITTLIQLLLNGVSAFLRYREVRQSGHLPAPAD